MMRAVLDSRNSAYSSDNFRQIDDGIVLKNLSIEGTISNALEEMAAEWAQSPVSSEAMAGFSSITARKADTRERPYLRRSPRRRPRTRGDGSPSSAIPMASRVTS